MSRAISHVKRATGKVNVADQLKIMNEMRFSALETTITKMGEKIDSMTARITDMNTSISDANSNFSRVALKSANSTTSLKKLVTAVFGI